MSKRTMNIGATMIALVLAGMTVAQAADTTNTDQTTTTTTSTTSSTSTTSLTSAGQTRVADKFAAPFDTLAGSHDNAVALATRRPQRTAR